MHQIRLKRVLHVYKVHSVKDQTRGIFSAILSDTGTKSSCNTSGRLAVRAV